MMDSIDDFTLGYIEAALWSSVDDEDVPLDSNYTINDIAIYTLGVMKKDCKMFVMQNESLLAQARSDSYNGHDFWLSRNGHGAGYFDRDLGEIGDKLQEIAQLYGEFNLYVGDDGKIHH